MESQRFGHKGTITAMEVERILLRLASSASPLIDWARTASPKASPKSAAADDKEETEPPAEVCPEKATSTTAEVPKAAPAAKAQGDTLLKGEGAAAEKPSLEASESGDANSEDTVDRDLQAALKRPACSAASLQTPKRRTTKGLKSP